MQDPYDNAELAEMIAGYKQQLAGRGRLLIRKSGTEPVIRVMVESDDKIECDMVANKLADRIRTVLG